MRFPFQVIEQLSDSQLERFRLHINSDRSGWHRKWTESIWRRHQHPSNARLSGWTCPDDQKRRLIHFYDEYDLQERSFVLRGSYLWLNLDLPEAHIEEYRGAVLSGLEQGGWERQGDDGWCRGALGMRMSVRKVHPYDAARGKVRPASYANLDLTVQTRGYEVPAGWVERPWRMFYDVELRKTLARGKARAIEPEEIAKHLPAQLELGCGPSIEAGIPHLSTLHRIYGVSLPDYGFVFRAEHDGLLELFRAPEKKYAEMTAIYRACMLAGSTPFYESVVDLTRQGLLVGPVITNNFDCQCADLGLHEVSLRRYDWGPYYPVIEHDPRAKSLLVVGVHADRRLVQMRARDRGLQVIFVDPEQYVAPDGRQISYPVEAPQDQDLFVRSTAHDALTRLASAIGARMS